MFLFTYIQQQSMSHYFHIPEEAPVLSYGYKN